MSLDHNEEQEKWTRDFVNQMMGAPPKYPQGKLSADDQGELAIAFRVDVKARTVIMRFPKPVDWIGFGKQEVLTLAAKLTELASQLP